MYPPAAVVGWLKPAAGADPRVQSLCLSVSPSPSLPLSLSPPLPARPPRLDPPPAFGGSGAALAEVCFAGEPLADSPIVLRGDAQVAFLQPLGPRATRRPSVMPALASALARNERAPAPGWCATHP